MNQNGYVRASVMALLAAVGLAMLFVASPAQAKPGVSLEQCRNGSFSSVNDCESLGGSAGWVAGNAGASNAHFHEGESIPYRLIMTDLPVGSPVTLELSYDVKHSGKFALDFLTHYDRIAEDVLPLSGVSGVSGTSDTEAVLKPSNSCGSDTQLDASWGSVPAGEKVMTLFGGTISNGSFAYISPQACLSSASSTTRVSIQFTPDSATAVLAWGGHIATSIHYGAGNSASGISGSPYHMRAETWSLGNLGNQDRSLSAAAVQPVTPGITTNPEAAIQIRDTATVGGAPSGTVDFFLYSDSTCTTLVSSQADVALVSGSATSQWFTVTPGTYYWKVHYDGDGGLNLPADSTCGETTTIAVTITP